MTTQLTYSESELTELLQQKELAAFHYLYDKYSPALYSLILSIVHDHFAAEELLQEIFFTVWKKIGSYQPSSGTIFSWLFRLTRMAAIDSFHVQQQTSKNLQVVGDGSWNGFDRDDEHAGLSQLLDRMKEDQRNLIELSLFKGYTEEEIADIESIPLGTVKTRIRHALMQMKTVM